MNTDKSIRSAREVSERAVILFCVTKVRVTDDRVVMRNWLKSQNLWNSVSRIEKKLFGRAKLSQKQIIDSSWRIEALEAVAWSLNLIDELTPSSEQCKSSRINEIFSFHLADASEFLSTTNLRSVEVIHHALDDIYEQHWKVRDAMLNNRQNPEALNSGVIREKHYALNWITRYENQSWDDVSTDT